MGTRVCVVNLGCKVNRVESDWMETAFALSGCTLVPEGEADIVAINTCAVTGEAEAKTRKAVRHAAGLPQRPLVAVTGCVANLFPDELEALSDNVRVFTAKTTLARDALNALERQRGAVVPACGHNDAGEGLLAHGAFRARRGIKVQDGCDNRCAYCIVWKARGPVRSEPLDAVLAQVRQVLAEGADEVVLSGINLGRFQGTDERGRNVDLGGLIDRVCALGPRMVRVSSVEPPDLTASVVDALARNADIACAHLHLPLQAGCDATLARMGRRYTARDFTRAVEALRCELPQVSISTDVIVGFPGETDGEFEQTYELCRSLRFSKMHVFRFSARPDTPAASMPGKVAPETMRARSERLRALASRMRADDAATRVGTTENVLVERVATDGAGTGTSASYHEVHFPAGTFSEARCGVIRASFIGSGEDGALTAEPVATA